MTVNFNGAGRAIVAGPTATCPATVAILWMLAFAVVGELVARVEPKEAYGVSVGEVSVLRHVGTDFWSKLDLMVRVQRQDPIVLDRIYELDENTANLRQKKQTLVTRINLLQKKKKASEVVPGEPLTAVQVERLAALVAEVGDTCTEFSARKCSGCSPYDEKAPCPQCAKCNELRYLKKRKVDSEVVPGEPLTAEESRELDALTRQQSELDKGISRAVAERRRLLASITSQTESVETNLKTVQFGHRKLLAVFPGDILEVAVYDDDVSDDDLYGKTVVVLHRRTLEAGELKLRMPNVRHVHLRFDLLVAEEERTPQPSPRTCTLGEGPPDPFNVRSLCTGSPSFVHLRAALAFVRSDTCAFSTGDFGSARAPRRLATFLDGKVVRFSIAIRHR